MAEELTEPGGKVRLYVQAPLAKDMRVAPDDSQAHYLLHVMRAKAGGRVSLFNGRDGEWLARIEDVSKRGCALVCEKQTETQREVPNLWLVFAPIKKTPADYLTQKATELGVRALQPVFTRRTIVGRVNTDRMRANAIEAAEQSGRLSVPEIREPMNLEKLLASWPRERRILFCDEAGEAPPIFDALLPPHPAGGGMERSDMGEGAVRNTPLPQSDFASAFAPRASADKPLNQIAPSRKGRGDSQQWAILTGPEGGFDPAERERIRALAHVTPVSLGGRILRADTAALAALAVWQAIRGDWH
jgi:16S rRNA (uracil1498-N3)-methyltransferase